jgi:hypothetical protein
MFHLAMGELFRGAPLAVAANAISSFVESESDKLAEAADGEETIGEFGPSVDTLVSQLIMDGHVAQAMAETYWETQGHRWLDKYEAVAIEKQIQIMEPSTKTVLQGTVDLILLKKDGTRAVLVDHKTTSRDIATFSEGMEFDWESRLYRLLLAVARDRELLPELPKDVVVSGILRNVVSRPSIRLKKTQEPEDYVAEVREWLLGTGRHQDKAELRKVKPAMLSTLALWTGDPLDVEMRNLLWQQKKASHVMPFLEAFPRLGAFTGVCKDHFGKPCVYLPLCSAPVDEWPRIVKQRYVLEDFPDDDPNSQE